MIKVNLFFFLAVMHELYMSKPILVDLQNAQINTIWFFSNKDAYIIGIQYVFIYLCF